MNSMFTLSGGKEEEEENSEEEIGEEIELIRGLMEEIAREQERCGMLQK